ncbi:Sec20-domain-containing protein, partial [Trametopsis cervina]
MPPIPSTLSQEIITQVESLARRQKDLDDFQIPRLRSCDGPLATQQQYAAELREDIETFARQLELLDIAVDDQQGERNRQELRRIVEENRRVLATFRKESRVALLASKRAIDAKKVSNREELFRSNAVREKQDLHEKVAEDAVMTASNNITEALQRTVTLMQGELDKSVLSTQLLEASSASLRSASSTHDVLDGLLTTSKYLITALEKSDWVDRLVIMAALVFFVLVVLFILKQRLVDRGLRIAFWWTRFIPSFSSPDDLLMDALEKGSSLSTVAEEVVTAVLTTA